MAVAVNIKKTIDTVFVINPNDPEDVNNDLLQVPNKHLHGTPPGPESPSFRIYACSARAHNGGESSPADCDCRLTSSLMNHPKMLNTGVKELMGCFGSAAANITFRDLVAHALHKDAQDVSDTTFLTIQGIPVCVWEKVSSYFRRDGEEILVELNSTVEDQGHSRTCISVMEFAMSFCGISYKQAPRP